MEGTGEAALYVLADRTGRLPAEIRAMPHRDYVGLVNYYHVKGVLEDMHRRAALGRR